MFRLEFCLFFFFFNDTATTEIYTLSLHDALPILELQKMLKSLWNSRQHVYWLFQCTNSNSTELLKWTRDRKSTRLNSSHGYISYAVFCLKKKKQTCISQSVSYNEQQTRSHASVSS